MRYGSVCSGIEAASVAWEPLGWRPAWFAEIEKFPSAVLAHHWPEVENLGDMTTIAGAVLRGTVEAPDILVGGTPCQAFSVAGMRRGLEDERGQLTIKYVELLNAIDLVRTRAGSEPAACVWENVPGVLKDKGNAFGCFLGALAGDGDALVPGPRPEPGRPGAFWRWCKKTGQHLPVWPESGHVAGPRRAIAWRVLDAQYFGLAAGRPRVFVVASAREGFDPAAVLFEREGVRRDSAPRREPRAGPAGGVPQRLAGGAELFGCLMASARKYHHLGNQEAFSGKYHIITGGRVRNPTLAEACRLLGFPDGFLDHFAARYWQCVGALGNSKAVPVVRWLGKRLQAALAVAP